MEDMFEKRISPYAKITSTTVSASKSDRRENARREEFESLSKKLKSDFFVIALDENGTQKTSEEFAAELEEIRDFKGGKVQFVIGGSHGLHPDIIQKADSVLSFSKMTFTHEMVRMFLKEQIYRAFSILAGKTYHK